MDYKGKKYIPISLDVLLEGVPLRSAVFIYLPLNKKIVHALPQDYVVEETKIASLRNKKYSQVYILDPSEHPEFYKNIEEMDGKKNPNLPHEFLQAQSNEKESTVKEEIKKKNLANKEIYLTEEKNLQSIQVDLEGSISKSQVDDTLEVLEEKSIHDTDEGDSETKQKKDTTAHKDANRNGEQPENDILLISEDEAFSRSQNDDDIETKAENNAVYETVEEQKESIDSEDEFDEQNETKKKHRKTDEEDQNSAKTKNSVKETDLSAATKKGILEDINFDHADAEAVQKHLQEEGDDTDSSITEQVDLESDAENSLDDSEDRTHMLSIEELEALNLSQNPVKTAQSTETDDFNTEENFEHVNSSKTNTNAKGNIASDLEELKFLNDPEKESVSKINASSSEEEFAESLGPDSSAEEDIFSTIEATDSEDDALAKVMSAMDDAKVPESHFTSDAFEETNEQLVKGKKETKDTTENRFSSDKFETDTSVVKVAGVTQREGEKEELIRVTSRSEDSNARKKENPYSFSDTERTVLSSNPNEANAEIRFSSTSNFEEESKKIKGIWDESDDFEADLGLDTYHDEEEEKRFKVEAIEEDNEESVRLAEAEGRKLRKLQRKNLDKADPNFQISAQDKAQIALAEAISSKADEERQRLHALQKEEPQDREHAEEIAAQIQESNEKIRLMEDTLKGIETLDEFRASNEVIAEEELDAIEEKKQELAKRISEQLEKLPLKSSDDIKQSDLELAKSAIEDQAGDDDTLLRATEVKDIVDELAKFEKDLNPDEDNKILADQIDVVKRNQKIKDEVELAKAIINISKSVVNHSRELSQLLATKPASEEEAQEIEKRAFELEQKIYDERQLLQDLNHSREVQEWRIAPYKEPPEEVYFIKADQPIVTEVVRVKDKLTELREIAKELKKESKEVDRILQKAMTDEIDEDEMEVAIKEAKHVEISSYAIMLAIAAGYDNERFHRSIAYATKVFEQPSIAENIEIPEYLEAIVGCIYDFNSSNEMAIRDAAQLIALAQLYMQSKKYRPGKIKLTKEDVRLLCQSLVAEATNKPIFEFELVERIERYGGTQGFTLDTKQYATDIAKKADTVHLQSVVQ